MKFGEDLDKLATPEWKQMYLDYKLLKKLVDNYSPSDEGNFRQDIIHQMQSAAEKGLHRLSNRMQPSLVDCHWKLRKLALFSRQILRKLHANYYL
jgi:SPX domain protein involved in polyphosphate accumulation